MINEIVENREYFEIAEDPIEEDNNNYNDKDYQNELNNFHEINRSDLDPIKAFKSIQLPEKEDFERIEFDFEYVPGKTDPYQRLLNLKAELLDTKNKIDDYANRYKNNEYIKETYNLSKIIDDMELYKTKIDAFINFDIFNNRNNFDYLEEGENQQGGNSENSKDDIKNFSSNFDKYNRITENLLNIIKNAENDTIEGLAKHSIVYEVISNPEKELDNLGERISELDEVLNNIERMIGNWLNNNNGETICYTLSKLLDFSLAKSSEKYDKKYNTFKECGSLISDFVTKRQEKIQIGGLYVKINEIYSVLELEEEYDSLINYIKKRLIVIKMIYNDSYQFQINIKNIEEKIKENSEKFEIMLKKYDETIKNFQEFDSILKEFSQLDKSIADLLV